MAINSMAGENIALISEALNRIAESTEKNNAQIASLVAGEKYVTKSLDRLTLTTTENHTKLTNAITEIVTTVSNLSMNGKRLEENTYDEIQRLRDKCNTLESYHKATVSDLRIEIKETENEFKRQHEVMEAKAMKAMEQWRDSFRKMHADMEDIKRLRAKEQGIRETQAGFMAFMKSNYMNIFKIIGFFTLLGAAYANLKT